MELLTEKVGNLLNEVNKQHRITLEHAAQISPFIHNISIGPDANPIESKDSKEHTENVSVSEKNISNQKKSPLRKSLTQKSNSPLSYQEFNSLQNLDFEAINGSVLMRESEECRKRSIRQKIIDMQTSHLERLQENHKPIVLHCQEERRNWMERKHENELLIFQKAEQESALELKEHNQQLESLRLQTQRQLQLISIQGISQYQQKFRTKYEVIVNLLMSIDKSSLIALSEYNKKFKELIQMFEQLITKIKGGDCGPAEMKNAENLCKSLADLEINILDALKSEKEKHEQVVKEHQKQEEKARQEAEKSAQEAESTVPEQSTTPNECVPVPERPPVDDVSASLISSQFVSAERLQFYTKINTFYQEKVERVKILQTDETMKKYRFECQKNINVPVNAISAVSQQHIQDKFDKLYSFVTTQPTLGKDYCILLMAKKFVGQGETTISSNPQAAFPVASVIVSLWKHIPEFGQLFLAYCFKECPFLVPYFIPQKKGQSIEEYSKVLGYRMTDGQLEQQDMYLKRHAGIARLYAAVMITNGRQQDGSTHPYGLEHAWRWLSNILALAPLPDMSATLIMEILQIVGSDLWTSYGRQFVKLLLFIQHHYFPKLSSVDSGGPKARLELLLSKFLREGEIQRPVGMLPSGFW